MKTRKSRRSGRAPANHRLVLTIQDPGGVDYLKEIITTTEISLYGARFRGRRTLKPGWRGTLGELESSHKVPVRIVWQAPCSSRAEYKEGAVEILAECNFWGQSFPTPDQEPQSTLQAAACLLEAVEHLQNSPEFNGRSKKDILNAVWSELDRQLAAKNPASEGQIAERFQARSSQNALQEEQPASAEEFVFDLSQSY